MTKQFDESFNNIMDSVSNKWASVYGALKKPASWWAAFLIYLVGAGSPNLLPTIKKQLQAKGEVNKQEVVEVVKDTFVKNNQVIPPDVEKRIAAVMGPPHLKQPKAIVKAQPENIVRISPKNKTTCDWPVIPVISSATSSDQKVYNFLVSTGRYTPMVAAAIVGNISIESSFDPKTKQIAKRTKGGVVYGPGRGIVQWEKGGRYDTDKFNLIKFAKSQNLEWDTLDAQVMFIDYEFSNHPQFIRLRDELNKRSNTDASFSLGDCVAAICKRYEKAGEPHMERRVQAAQLFADNNSLTEFVKPKAKIE